MLQAGAEEKCIQFRREAIAQLRNSRSSLRTAKRETQKLRRALECITGSDANIGKDGRG
jgi:hypothetical protein